jgi:hypothetical protein
VVFFVGLSVFGSDAGTVGSLPAVLTAAALLCSWLYAMVNTTTVWIGRGGFEVSHGPLPSWLSGEAFHAAQVFPVTVLAAEEGLGYRYRRTVYGLHIGTAGKVALAKWNYRAPLDFVRDGIRKVVAQGVPTSY